MTRSITDVLQNALEGIERHQGDNPDAKLDALRRHIAVFLADLETSAPTYPKKRIILHDRRGRTTYAKKRVVRHETGKRAPSGPVAIADKRQQ